ncbi:MAG: cytochrome c oxidase accessory protein CcoG [Rubrivivax sp.]|nr:cytochrome c oxidase accessory protein CcoG [Rubrivivax sp.]MBK8526046.1 cytochrome c oxidase accessory protein CcoG [Rubrivivax sp.]
MVSMYEKQAKVYPRAVTGLFARWRWTMVWLTQLVFYGMPWLTWNGRQAVLFDLNERRFHIFGLLLQPQDLIYLAALLVISALALFLFTAVAGRLWCGYACPQTVYTELFLWVERRLEGDRQARIRLDAAPWGLEKLARKGAKQAVWLAIGLVTGFTFVGYFTPIRSLAADAVALAFTPWEWFWVLFYGAATYGNAGYLREQVCKYMCPYARFQSALIDKDSLVIAYDTGRGEARGSRSRKADPKALGLGDCIDCTLCVQVCPTGIDIRNGLQNECIGCAACIDVCDDVMGKMGYAPGLIRYSTENGVAKGWTRAQMMRRALRPRVLLYAAALLLVSGAFVISLSMRSGFSVDVFKDRGALAREIQGGVIENTYTLHLSNLSEQPRQYRLAVSGLPGLELRSAARLDVGAMANRTWPVQLALPPQAAQSLRGRAHAIEFEVSTGDGAEARTRREKATFYVPR